MNETVEVAVATSETPHTGLALEARKLAEKVSITVAAAVEQLKRETATKQPQATAEPIKRDVPNKQALTSIKASNE